LGGASSGGYGAVNIGLKHPDIYSMMISLSGYYRADPTGWARPVWGRHPSNSDLLENSPVDYLANGNPQWRQDFIYVGDGTSDRTYYRNSDKQMVAALTRQGIPYAFQLVPGRHSWDLWRTLLVNALGDLRPRLIDVSKPAG
jgi:S-formylglutathione hydrolase FrmB